MRSLLSAHSILSVEHGEFVSLLETPDVFKENAAQCKNTGTWPVLVGEDGQRDAMLSSPIILYDYPQIAPESAGDLFDGTEIDEILALRILTLTENEKQEMRDGDERARQILERTEALPEEQFLKLHGVLRGMRPSSEGRQ
jgi:hydrogenase maturation protease